MLTHNIDGGLCSARGLIHTCGCNWSPAVAGSRGGCEGSAPLLTNTSVDARHGCCWVAVAELLQQAERIRGWKEWGERS